MFFAVNMGKDIKIFSFCSVFFRFFSILVAICSFLVVPPMVVGLWKKVCVRGGELQLSCF